MSNTIHNELMALAAEVAAHRQSINKRQLPKAIWKRAIDLAQQSSVNEVCQATKISPTYLKRKMSTLALADAKMTFVELIAPKHDPSHIVRINFESSSGHKMMIIGIDSTAIVPLLAEFLREGGLPCCK
jgi:hypothetical protein